MKSRPVEVKKGTGKVNEFLEPKGRILCREYRSFDFISFKYRQMASVTDKDSKDNSFLISSFGL